MRLLPHLCRNLKRTLCNSICAVSLNGAALSAVEQPTSVPGKFLMPDQHFPAIDTVIQKQVQSYPVYGVYSWMGEYRQLREQIKQVNWGTLRISGPMNDDDYKMLLDDGHNFSYMIAHPKDRRDGYESDEAYINASLEAAEAFLDRYGENGSFYKENPAYKNRYIPFMQLRNEPNFHYMWKAGSEAQRETLYAALAPQLIALLKKKSPKTKIINFTTGGAGAGDMRFIKSVLKKDPRNITEVDVIATHPYVDPVPPECNKIESWGSYSIANSLHTLRKIFSEYGHKDIPVWYTEGGWMISKADGAAYDKPADKVVSLELQAAYSCRYYALALRLGVDCVTNMFITDTDGYPGGFFDRNNAMKWRLSAFAVQNMIKLMPHPALRGAQSDGEDGTYIYEFAQNALKKNSPSIVMAYRVEGPKEVSINVSSKKTFVTDMLGETTTINTPQGLLTQELGPLPIYISEAK